MKRKQRIRKPWSNSSVKKERKGLRNKSVLLGVSGGAAAYKAVELIRRLKDEGAAVIVIMTEAAKKFITSLSLEIASQNKVYSDLFGDSMNWRMYETPFFQETLKCLLSRGVIQVGPEKGSPACGEEGIGRMSDIPEIIEAIKSALSQKDLEKEKILVTAGPTREYLDPVRFISNRSSGKMGYAIARAALRRGAEVVLVSGPSALGKPKGVKFIPVETTVDMINAVNQELPSSTVLIMSAAVSDFTTVKSSRGKIEKSG